jgi:hypothetical protein
MAMKAEHWLGLIMAIAAAIMIWEGLNGRGGSGCVDHGWGVISTC